MLGYIISSLVKIAFDRGWVIAFLRGQRNSHCFFHWPATKAFLRHTSLISLSLRQSDVRAPANYRHAARLMQLTCIGFFMLTHTEMDHLSIAAQSRLTRDFF